MQEIARRYAKQSPVSPLLAVSASRIKSLGGPNTNLRKGLSLLRLAFRHIDQATGWLKEMEELALGLADETHNPATRERLVSAYNRRLRNLIELDPRARFQGEPVFGGSLEDRTVRAVDGALCATEFALDLGWRFTAHTPRSRASFEQGALRIWADGNQGLTGSLPLPSAPPAHFTLATRVRLNPGGNQLLALGVGTTEGSPAEQHGLFLLCGDYQGPAIAFTALQRGGHWAFKHPLHVAVRENVWYTVRLEVCGRRVALDVRHGGQTVGQIQAELPAPAEEFGPLEAVSFGSFCSFRPGIFSPADVSFDYLLVAEGALQESEFLILHHNVFEIPLSRTGACYRIGAEGELASWASLLESAGVEELSVGASLERLARIVSALQTAQQLSAARRSKLEKHLAAIRLLRAEELQRRQDDPAKVLCLQKVG